MRNPKAWRRLWILLLIPASSLVLQAALCGSDGADGNPNAPTVSLSVRLHNLDTPVIGQSIHILGPGEEFSPSNRLEPGDSRNLSITMREGGKASFRVGRNGSYLATGGESCTCSTACPPNQGGTIGSPKVEWNGTTLSCVGW